MRADAIGMFWEDIPVKSGRRETVRVMPPIPDTGWRPPTHRPDLSRAACISIDCETYDPELLTHGPGWARGRGHIVGVSIATDDGSRRYFPIRHEVEPQDNLDPEVVLQWLATPSVTPASPRSGPTSCMILAGFATRGLPFVES